MLKLDINIVFTIINLLVLFVLSYIFLFKPLNRMLAKRQEEIEKGYVDADAAKQDALEMKSAYEKSMAEANIASKETVSKAKKQAQDEYDRIIAQANLDAEQIILKAREQAAEERAQALRMLEAEMSDLVITAAKKVVGKSNTSLIDSRLYDEFLAEAGEDNGSEGN